MSKFYKRMQGVADKLLTKFDQGGIVLLKHSNDGGTPWEPVEKWEPIPVEATALGVSAHHLQDSRIQASDQVVTIAGIYTPTMKDRVSIAGREHSIVKLEPKPAAGIVAAWAVFVRA